jgi:DNA-binding YbaB/EbfC family protein
MAKGFNSRGRGGMAGMPNMNMLKKAQQMQAEMQRTQAALEEKNYTATAAGGMVTAVVSGKRQIVSLEIKPEIVDPEDVEMLQDSIVAAVNEAFRAVDDDLTESMNKLTSGMNLSGLGL